MNPTFLDTSGLIAVVNTDDQWHAKAAAIWQQMIVGKTPLLTTALVLIELGDGLSRIHQRSLAVQLYDRLHNAPQIEIVPCSEPLEEKAWQLFRNRPDKEWGVTDCASFAVMQERGIFEAFTADHHFEEAGFVRLLRA